MTPLAIAIIGINTAFGIGLLLARFVMGRAYHCGYVAGLRQGMNEALIRKWTEQAQRISDDELARMVGTVRPEARS